jgi:hypothetical protein
MLIRTLVLAILVLLAVALGIVLVGSIRPDLPTPFGVAGNGQVAYSSNNDIFLIDPITGVSRPITSGPQLESQPIYSPDGTLLAYKRMEADVSDDSYDLVVTDADGSNPRTIATWPVTYWSGWEQLLWRRTVARSRSTGGLRELRSTMQRGCEPRVSPVVTTSSTGRRGATRSSSVAWTCRARGCTR